MACTGALKSGFSHRLRRSDVTVADTVEASLEHPLYVVAEPGRQVQRGREQLFLGPEEMSDERGVDARLGCDAADRGCLISLGAELVSRGGEDCGSGSAIAATAATRVSCHVTLRGHCAAGVDCSAPLLSVRR